MYLKSDVVDGVVESHIKDNALKALWLVTKTTLFKRCLFVLKKRCYRCCCKNAHIKDNALKALWLVSKTLFFKRCLLLLKNVVFLNL